MFTGGEIHLKTFVSLSAHNGARHTTQWWVHYWKTGIQNVDLIESQQLLLNCLLFWKKWTCLKTMSDYFHKKWYGIKYLQQFKAHVGLLLIFWNFDLLFTKVNIICSLNSVTVKWKKKKNIVSVTNNGPK